MEQDAQGRKMVVWHDREFRTLLVTGRNDYPIHGRTIAVIWVGNLRMVGVAFCSEGDTFSRRKGRLLAVGRATVALERPSFGRKPLLDAFTFVAVKGGERIAETFQIPEWMWLEDAKREVL